MFSKKMRRAEEARNAFTKPINGLNKTKLSVAVDYLTSQTMLFFVQL